MARSARMHLFTLMLSGVSSRSQVDRSSLVAGLSLSQLATTHAGFRVLRGFTHTVSRHPASPTRRQRQSPDAHLLLHPWQEGPRAAPATRDDSTQPALLCVDQDLEGGLHQRLRRRCLCFLVRLGLLLSVVHVRGGDAVSAIDQLQLRTRPAVNSLCTVVNMFSGDRELYCC